MSKRLKIISSQDPTQLEAKVNDYLILLNRDLSVISVHIEYKVTGTAVHGGFLFTAFITREGWGP